MRWGHGELTGLKRLLELRGQANEYAAKAGLDPTRLETEQLDKARRWHDEQPDRELPKAKDYRPDPTSPEPLINRLPGAPDLLAGLSAPGDEPALWEALVAALEQEAAP